MTRASTLAWLTVAVTSVVTPAAMGQPLDVPFFVQYENGCGAASVAMVTHYWASRPARYTVTAASPSQVYRSLYNPGRKGILLADMKRYLEQSGLRAFTLTGRWTDIERHISKGRPVIVGLKKGRSNGMHFAVVVGMDENYVFLNDPTRKKVTRLKQAQFKSQWERADAWMLLATPAGT